MGVGIVVVGFMLVDGVGCWLELEVGWGIDFFVWEFVVFFVLWFDWIDVSF